MTPLVAPTLIVGVSDVEPVSHTKPVNIDEVETWIWYFVVISKAFKSSYTAVNSCRIFSFGASWSNRAHEKLFSDWLRKKHFSVYGLMFMMTVEINRGSATAQGYRSLIDYVLDGLPVIGRLDAARRWCGT